MAFHQRRLPSRRLVALGSYWYHHIAGIMWLYANGYIPWPFPERQPVNRNGGPWVHSIGPF